MEYLKYFDVIKKAIDFLINALEGLAKAKNIEISKDHLDNFFHVTNAF